MAFGDECRIERGIGEQRPERADQRVARAAGRGVALEDGERGEALRGLPARERIGFDLDQALPRYYDWPGVFGEELP